MLLYRTKTVNSIQVSCHVNFVVRQLWNERIMMLTKSVRSNNVKNAYISMALATMAPAQNISQIHGPQRCVLPQMKALRKRASNCKLFQTFLLKYLSHSFSSLFSFFFLRSSSELNCRLWRTNKGGIFFSLAGTANEGEQKAPTM